jgi:hypothetical protein
MKPVNALIHGARETLTTSSPTTIGDSVQDQDQDQESQRRAVGRIFATLKTVFPAWFEKHYGTKPAETMAKRIWLVATRDLTDAQVDRGLHRLVNDCTFPPCPKDFVTMARRVEGFPTPDQAWLEALSGKAKHEAVRIAASLTGHFDLCRADPGDLVLRKAFERNFEIIQRRAEAGQALDGSIPTGIGHDSQKSPAELTAEHCEQDLRRRLEAQQLDQISGQACRAALMKSLGIKRA